MLLLCGAVRWSFQISAAAAHPWLLVLTPTPCLHELSVSILLSWSCYWDAFWHALICLAQDFLTLYLVFRPQTGCLNERASETCLKGKVSTSPCTGGGCAWGKALGPHAAHAQPLLCVLAATTNTPVFPFGLVGKERTLVPTIRLFRAWGCWDSCLCVAPDDVNPGCVACQAYSVQHKAWRVGQVGLGLCLGRTDTLSYPVDRNDRGEDVFFPVWENDSLADSSSTGNRKAKSSRTGAVFLDFFLNLFVSVLGQRWKDVGIPGMDRYHKQKAPQRWPLTKFHPCSQYLQGSSHVALGWRRWMSAWPPGYLAQDEAWVSQQRKLACVCSCTGCASVVWDKKSHCHGNLHTEKQDKELCTPLTCSLVVPLCIFFAHFITNGLSQISAIVLISTGRQPLCIPS